MEKHNDSKFYISSLSILGVRGTLRTFDGIEYLNGKFYGKTGTLNGVRSISGYLNSKQGYLYISLIYNGEGEVDDEISSILKSVYINRNCSY